MPIKHVLTTLCLLASLSLSHYVRSAPDEQALCKHLAYPIGTAQQWFNNECTRVGSFSHFEQIPGLYGGYANPMLASSKPMVLPKAEHEPDYRWRVDKQGDLTLDDYLDRQRVTALLVIKDGVIQVERYQYDRTATHRFLSNSMAKSLTSIAIGLAVAEGKIKSLDNTAQTYAVEIKDTLYGQTTVRNLLRMASGAQFEERYTGYDDLAKYHQQASLGGVAAGARIITQRAVEQGQRFNYASPETDMLGLVLRGATGQTVSSYLESRLWKPMGASDTAYWRADRSGLERTGGNFAATARDYARLGVLLANDGVRPDAPHLGQIIPKEYLLEATDKRFHAAPFQPRVATPYFGYGYLFWTFPTQHRRFAMLGVYGQAIYIDPALKLVMVHLAVNATANSAQTSLAAERDALWRAVVSHYGAW